MSPEIQRIMKKAAAGQELTEAEQQALEAWGEAMQKKGEEFLKANPGLANPPENPCPKPQKSPPRQSASQEEYLALLKQLVTIYGAKVGKARLSWIAPFRVPPSDFGCRSGRGSGGG
jgi:hypothetical protein